MPTALLYTRTSEGLVNPLRQMLAAGWKLKGIPLAAAALGKHRIACEAIYSGTVRLYQHSDGIVQFEGGSGIDMVYVDVDAMRDELKQGPRRTRASVQACIDPALFLVLLATIHDGQLVIEGKEGFNRALPALLDGSWHKNKTGHLYAQAVAIERAMRILQHLKHFYFEEWRNQTLNPKAREVDLALG